MKWNTIDIGSACYYITITEWLPLVDIPQIRQRVCDDIKPALETCGGSLPAFVIMPTHVHRFYENAEQVCLPVTPFEP